MSLSEQTECECPDCKRLGSILCYRSVNVTVDPELKEALIAGSLNVIECGCGAQTLLASDMLYHDMEAQYQIYLIHPDERGVIDLSGIAMKLGATLPGYKLRIVRSRNSLLEKVLLFDAGLDDRAVEVLKLLMVPALPGGLGDQVTDIRSTGTVSDGSAGESLAFLLFPSESDDPFGFTLPREEHYEPLLATLRHYCPERMSTTPGWQLVERGYAELLLDAIQAAEEGEAGKH